jgi:glycosyltransferase involved in cell wall biosynthesis
LFNRMFLQQCLRAADAIACVSESTLRRLDMYVPRYVMQKALTVYNCVDPGPAMSTKGPLRRWKGEPFVLCVAQHRRNKNIVFAMKVFRRLLLDGHISPYTRLVVVGIEGPETADIRAFIRDNDLNRHVILLQGIDDADLAWCYGRCEFLLAPSIVEGFGLPIVEAMLHHCRIICSDIAAFREVGGSYCYYASLEPAGEDAFVKAILSALGNVKFRESSVERFSSARIAEAYIEIYTDLRQAYAAGRSRNLVHSLERGRP